jgi:hypothetical protein
MLVLLRGYRSSREFRNGILGAPKMKGDIAYMHFWLSQLGTESLDLQVQPFDFYHSEYWIFHMYLHQNSMSYVAIRQKPGSGSS